METAAETLSDECLQSVQTGHYLCQHESLGGFPPLSCACGTMSSGSGCSGVGQLCAGREGSGRDGLREEAALCGHILFD